MKTHTSHMLAALAAFLAVGAGCQHIKSSAATGAAKLDAEYAAYVSGGGLANDIRDYLAKFGDGSKTENAAGIADAVDFALFDWRFGGFNGAAAVAHPGDPVISGLSFSSTGLAFKYDVDLSVWGMTHTDAGGALACLFVQRSDGSWVGGKFDWISSSRMTRGFKGHVIPGVDGGTYNGWSLDGVPNPCRAAFVIVSKSGRQRSNILIAEWRR